MEAQGNWRPISGNKKVHMSGSEMAEHRQAPDFVLMDSKGRQVRLSSYKGVRNVVLVFNRGFL